MLKEVACDLIEDNEFVFLCACFEQLHAVVIIIIFIILWDVLVSMRVSLRVKNLAGFLLNFLSLYIACLVEGPLQKYSTPMLAAEVHYKARIWYLIHLFTYLHEVQSSIGLVYE